jgi:membrane protein required for colicin V production
VNYLDILLLVFLAAGLVRGLLKGFIYEIAVLGCLFLGYFLGFKIADSIAPTIQKIIHVDGRALQYVSYLIVCIGISVGIFFLAKLFEGLVNIVALGIFNKIAGAIFGVLKHLLIASLIIYFFNKPDTKYKIINPDTKAASKFYYPVLRLASAVLISDGSKRSTIE